MFFEEYRKAESSLVTFHKSFYHLEKSIRNCRMLLFFSTCWVKSILDTVYSMAF